jgi:hypothetical protein
LKYNLFVDGKSNPFVVLPFFAVITFLAFIMAANHPSSRDDFKAKPPAVHQLTLNADTNDTTFGQIDDRYLATKWEIWAYYACVVYKHVR